MKIERNDSHLSKRAASALHKRRVLAALRYEKNVEVGFHFDWRFVAGVPRRGCFARFSRNNGSYHVLYAASYDDLLYVVRDYLDNL